MKRTGGYFSQIALAMAGRRSPWGGSSGGGDNGGNGGDGPPEDSGSGGSGDSPPPRGPRNPWLPGGGESGGDAGPDRDGPRRTGNIEDLFRKRGPEGPRRTPGGPGGPNIRLPERPGGGSWFPLVLGAVVVVGLGISMVHQVGPKEQGIVTTVGKYSRTLQPGLNFTLPWPIQQVSVEPVSTIRSFRIPAGGQEKLILTGDQNLVDLTYLIRWNIKDLKQFRFQLAQPEETINEVAEAAMRASVAERTLDETFSGAGRAEIEQRVRDRMQAVLDAYRSGIAVQGVEIGKTDPPERVVEAFKDVSAAQQDADADINRARAWAQQVLAQAEGEAAAFDKVYAEYKLAPDVTRQRMYYETMERVLGKTNKTIVEAPGVTPYLPLPEIKQRATKKPEGQ
ncbi:HflK protein [Caenibius tardaugens NBRC 16725]|uniref:Protein HflK n=1 Tax=Caenibius tardaugens NBRC 16725 TaxID=1219035 RepID=U2ZZL4_9SPHN|nr:FtsH protease activity modulator HflK [Caenibius tardaugens]GAD50809.1 HflK protein [Caenibius tardaugens NBRC 16725]